MAISTSRGAADWRRKHFLIRLAGLTGLLVGAAGVVLMIAGYLWAGIVVGVLGGAAVAYALGIEILNLTQVATARRGAAGTNVALQVLLAIALLVEVNGFSFFHYHRFDWTRDREFTIPAKLQADLGKLRGETTIVVHLTHNFGQLTDKRDEFDHAAERVVIDKVEDMVEQFREFGPRFRVIVLDVKDRRYRHKLGEVTKDWKELGPAIKATSEDSIFILARDKVQRLGFQEIFQLDKKSSQKANHERGNLVMNYQGIDPFARRLLNLDDRKPRIAVGVIHEWLTTESKEDRFCMAGVKKALTARGFETRDIMLKKWERGAPPTASVLTFDENKHESLRLQIANLDQTIKIRRARLKELKRQLKLFRSATVSLKDLNKEFGQEFNETLGIKKIDKDIRQAYIDRLLEPNITLNEVQVEKLEKEHERVVAEQKKLNVTNLAEQRRITDLKAKLERKLADCDLLILPRMTLYDVAEEDLIPNQAHQLDPAQVAAIKDFLKKGKPVLALFGPTNEPGNLPPMDLVHGRSDGVEQLLGELGISFSKETFLYDEETKTFGVRRGKLLFQGTEAKIPPLRFARESGAPGGSLTAKRNVEPNPIAESMQLTLAGLSDSQDLDLEIKHPRPLEFIAPDGKEPARDPAFLFTDPRGWKESKPFATEDRIPQPDPKKSGQVPVGVAVETLMPPAWKAQQNTVRVAAIGHGGIFIGKQLAPVREKLLLDVSNWLLGRDDLLNRKNIPWEYPRVAMSNSAFTLWVLAIWLGIPLLFAYLGVVVLMKRTLH
jgi:hypothetical protein